MTAGSEYGAGIGGDYAASGNGGTIEITGGWVTATGGTEGSGAGIGGGACGSGTGGEGSTVTIRGGVVTIRGGVVTAGSKSHSAGIGGGGSSRGSGGSGGTVEITGGAGIGGSASIYGSGDGGTVSISAANVTAKSDTGGYAIQAQGDDLILTNVHAMASTDISGSNPVPYDPTSHVDYKYIQTMYSCATIDDVTVSGTTGTAITDTDVTIMLEGTTFNALLQGDVVSG